MALTTAQIPSHTHAITAGSVMPAMACRNGAGNQQTPVGNLPAIGIDAAYRHLQQPGAERVDAAGNVAFSGTASRGDRGRGRGTKTCSRILTLNYCIALQGIFPARSEDARTCIGPIPLANQAFLLQLRPEGLGAVQPAAAADQPEPGAVLAARHDLRRQRPDHVRAAGSARPRARSEWGQGLRDLGQTGGSETATLDVPTCRSTRTRLTRPARRDGPGQQRSAPISGVRSPPFRR